MLSDCPSGGVSNCHNVGWPGYRTTAWHQAAKQFRTNLWFGSLVDGMRDASVQMYMRNRYYDPATGQFTQADPIGLAGGLNAYGFAAGDPISYSDPYGLCILGRLCEALKRAGDEAVRFWAERAANADTRAGRYIATTMGVFASLCTSDTCDSTDRALRAAATGNVREVAATLRGGVRAHSDQELENTLQRIEDNDPKYAQDGTTFRNREGRLPASSDPNYYQEWTVDTPGATNRGARRIVTGKGGETYYTSDHYRTFTRLTDR